MRRAIIGLMASAGLLVGMTGTAQADIDVTAACEITDDYAFQGVEERQYLSNPLRNYPRLQAQFIAQSWSLNGYDPFPRYNNGQKKTALTAVCVNNYERPAGAFGVTWHIRMETRVRGNGNQIDWYYNTARDCYGTTATGGLVAPPDCSPYGAVDYNSALD